MSESDLMKAYARLCEHESFDGSHVSLDRDHRGDEALNVAADWIEQAGVQYALELARELELELVLTKGGLRIAMHSNEFSGRVQDVKRTLREEDAE